MTALPYVEGTTNNTPAYWWWRDANVGDLGDGQWARSLPTTQTTTATPSLSLVGQPTLKWENWECVSLPLATKRLPEGTPGQ